MYLAYLVHWAETEDPGLKLAVFCTGPAIRNTAANLITEIIGTAVLLFGILALPAEFPTGLAVRPAWLLGIGMSLGGPTGYAINPARDLGPRIMHFDPADRRQGRLGLGVLVDPGRRSRSSAACIGALAREGGVRPVGGIPDVAPRHPRPKERR